MKHFLDKETFERALTMMGINKKMRARILHDGFKLNHGDPNRLNFLYELFVSPRIRYLIENPPPFIPLLKNNIPDRGIWFGNLENHLQLFSGFLLPLILIFGAMGSGKTNYIHFLIDQFKNFGYFILLITYKIQEIPKEFVVFRMDSSIHYRQLPIFVNTPNIPPRGVSYEAWFKALVRFLGERIGFMDIGISYCYEMRMKTLEENHGRPFTMSKVLDYMLQNPPKTNSATFPKWTRNKDWLEALQMWDRESFYAVKGHDWEEWLNLFNCVSLLTHANPPINQWLKVIELVSRIIETREANYSSSARPILIVIEEAHVYCPRQKTLSTVSELANLIRRGRSCNVHFCLTGHSPSLFDVMALTNATAIINTGVVSDSDLRLISDVMGLNAKQAERMKDLRLDEAVVKCNRS